MRAYSKKAHHFDLNIPSGQIESLIKENPPIYLWATHQGFFHNLLRICSGTYLLGFSQYTHNKLSMNSLSICLSILWLYLWVNYERTFDEWLRHIVGIFWSNLWKKPKGFFNEWLKGILVGFLWSNSQFTHWVHWDQSGGLFWISSHFTHWVFWEQSEK